MRNTILQGDALERLRELPDESVHMVCTSPPYWSLRDYGVTGQIGLEATLDDWLAALVAVFAEVGRVLRNDGTLWLNIGDGYSSDTKGSGGGWAADPTNYAFKAQAYGARKVVTGLKPKDLLCQPWRLAMALQAEGWYLRSAFPWVKRSAMPESVQDRPTSALEYIFLLTRDERYYCDMEAVRKELLQSSTERGYTAAYMDGEEVGKSLIASGEVRAKANWRKNGYVPSGRNLRNADFWYESVLPPYGLVGVGDEIVGLDVVNSGSDREHYAAFPEALVLPLLKMGTSERGCCAECGAPWVRVVERDVRVLRREPAHAFNNSPTKVDSTGWTDGNPRTVGWQPGCKHEAPLQPALILDPFLGSGTVAVVAARAGRDWLGIELNPDYVAMAEERLAPVKARLL